MIEVIDDLVPESYSGRLVNACMSMPWYLLENISGYDKSLGDGTITSSFQFGFSHQAMDANGTSGEFEKFLPLIYVMEEKTNIKVNELYRVRIALNTFTGVETQHNAHVDMEDPHKVLLYYVNDSDGDTIMYQEMFEEGKPKPSIFTVKQRIAPKRNRAVVFDGLRYHSSSKPTKNPFRFIVNVDFN